MQNNGLLSTPIAIPGTVSNLHGKEEWRLQMEFKLLIRWPWDGEIVLDYPNVIISSQCNTYFARSQREELRPWQRSWGRRLRHTQRWDRASGNPLFPSTYPQNQSLPTLLFHALTYTSDFMGAVPHRFSQRRSKLAAPVNKNSWVWQGCLRSNLSARRLACVTGLSTLLPLCTWLFPTSQP